MTTKSEAETAERTPPASPWATKDGGTVWTGAANRDSLAAFVDNYRHEDAEDGEGDDKPKRRRRSSKTSAASKARAKKTESSESE
jgi:hypothetical protein